MIDRFALVGTLFLLAIIAGPCWSMVRKRQLPAGREVRRQQELLQQQVLALREVLDATHLSAREIQLRADRVFADMEMMADVPGVAALIADCRSQFEQEISARQDHSVLDETADRSDG